MTIGDDMTLQDRVFHRPVIVASADVDLRCHCVIRIMDHITHILTIADFRHDNIPAFVRDNGILLVDEHLLPSSRKLHRANISDHGWNKRAVVLCRTEVQEAENYPLTYLTLPLDRSSLVKFIKNSD